jgi:uncharacterized protein
VPLITVIIPALLSYQASHLSIESYALELFNYWGIGRQQRNYGILLLISKGDRRARIEFGAAWAHRHDFEAQQVMDTLIIPQFKEGNFSGGVLAGVRGLDALARGLALPKPQAPWWAGPLTAGLAVTAIGVVISLFRNGRRGWGWALIAFLGILIFTILSASASRSGSRGAFGGGSGGGGGASGSW